MLVKYFKTHKCTTTTTTTPTKGQRLKRSKYRWTKLLLDNRIALKQTHTHKHTHTHTERGERERERELRLKTCYLKCKFSIQYADLKLAKDGDNLLRNIALSYWRC